MEQLFGYEEPGKEDWIWELQKRLYGMNRAAESGIQHFTQ
jgi:hypothetical protein